MSGYTSQQLATLQSYIDGALDFNVRKAKLSIVPRAGA
jgi:hypothetical protein